MRWQDATDPRLADYIANLTALRRRHAVFRRLDFFTGRIDAGAPAGTLKDIYWLSEDGRELSGDAWGEGERHVLGMQLGNNGEDDERLLLLFNASRADVGYRLAPDFPCIAFAPVFESGSADGLTPRPEARLAAGGTFPLEARSFVLLKHVAEA